MVQGREGVQQAEASKSGWVRRPFARTFDLLSSQYGWTDDQILDLTLGRMRQARDVALERLDEDWKQDLRVREQELRWICGTVAASMGNKKGVKAAARIELFERRPEERPLPSAEAIARMFPDEVPETLAVPTPEEVRLYSG